jgi:hypothetical protein
MERRVRGRALRYGHLFEVRAEPEPTPILRKHLSVFGPDEPHKCGVPLGKSGQSEILGEDVAT